MCLSVNHHVAVISADETLYGISSMHGGHVLQRAQAERHLMEMAGILLHPARTPR